MKEVIENILEEEKMARERVEEARNKAKQIKLDAEEEAKKILEQARVNGTAEARELLIQVEKEAQQEREAELKKAKKTMLSMWGADSKGSRDLVKRLLQKILGKDVS